MRQIRFIMMNWMSLESCHKLKVHNIWPACWCADKTRIRKTWTDSLINSALKESTVGSYRISIYLFALTSFLSDSKCEFDPEADGHWQYQWNIYLNKISKRSPRESKVSVTGLQNTDDANEQLLSGIQMRHLLKWVFYNYIWCVMPMKVIEIFSYCLIIINHIWLVNLG